MKRSRFTEQQIVAVLKEADAGMSVRDLCRRHGISHGTYYHWKSKYGGLEASDLKRMKELEAENAKLREDLALLETTLAGGARGAAPLTIRRFTVEPLAKGEYRYRLILLASGIARPAFRQEFTELLDCLGERQERISIARRFLKDSNGCRPHSSAIISHADFVFVEKLCGITFGAHPTVDSFQPDQVRISVALVHLAEQVRVGDNLLVGGGDVARCPQIVLDDSFHLWW